MWVRSRDFLRLTELYINAKISGVKISKLVEISDKVERRRGEGVDAKQGLTHLYLEWNVSLL